MAREHMGDAVSWPQALEDIHKGQRWRLSPAFPDV